VIFKVLYCRGYKIPPEGGIFFGFLLFFVLIKELMRHNSIKWYYLKLDMIAVVKKMTLFLKKVT